MKIFIFAGRIFTSIAYLFSALYFFLWIVIFLGISLSLLGVFSFFFLISGSLFLYALGISSQIFWGHFLNNFNQIFSVNQFFLSFYDYLIIGFWGLSFSLFLIYSNLLVIASFFSLFKFNKLYSVFFKKM